MAVLTTMLIGTLASGCGPYSLEGKLDEAYQPLGNEIIGRPVSRGGHGMPFSSGYEWVSCRSGLSVSVESGGALSLSTNPEEHATTARSTNTISVRDFLDGLPNGGAAQMAPDTLRSARSQGFFAYVGAKRNGSDASFSCNRAYRISGNDWLGNTRDVCVDLAANENLTELEKRLCEARIARIARAGATQ